MPVFAVQGVLLVHGVGLVHGDIKGGNSKVDMQADGSDLHAAVLDLGSCYPLGTSELTQPSLSLGRLQAMLLLHVLRLSASLLRTAM